MVALDFADSAVVAVVPPISIESAGALLSLYALVLSGAGSTIKVLPLAMKFLKALSLMMLSVLDTISSALEVSGPYLEAVESVMHFS